MYIRRSNSQKRRQISKEQFSCLIFEESTGAFYIRTLLQSAPTLARHCYLPHLRVNSNDVDYFLASFIHWQHPVEVSISSYQVAAAATALGNDLRADGYKKAKVLIQGFIYQFTMGVVTNVVASYFVTNKVQVQDTGVTDTCGSAQINNLENMVKELQANIQDLGTKIQAGDSRPRGYDRFAETTDTQKEGVHLKHTVKPTQDPEDYKTIAGCDLGSQ